MRTVRINSKHSPVSGSITATNPSFLNYASIVKDAASLGEMEKEYKAERIVFLKNSTCKETVYMVIETLVSVSFEKFGPKLKNIVGRIVRFYCLDKKNQLEEVKPTFSYNGKTLSYEELVHVQNFSESFIYSDSDLGWAIHRSISSRKSLYRPQTIPFTERVFS